MLTLPLRDRQTVKSEHGAAHSNSAGKLALVTTRSDTNLVKKWVAML
jgi:hypothetical protein